MFQDEIKALWDKLMANELLLINSVEAMLEVRIF